jgi:hypothetical protein
MEAVNQPKKHKYNCLFLPGLPGKIKRFSFFDDITDTGGKIYWLQYSGTYDNSEVDKFTIYSSIRDIKESLDQLSKEGIPILVIAYSYSTYLVNLVDFSDYPLVFGMSLFSPIHGLSSKYIGEDFVKTIEQLVSDNKINSDLSYWEGYIENTTPTNFNDNFKRLSNYDFPVMIAYAQGDAVIKAEVLSRELDRFCEGANSNKLLIFRQPFGYHRVDSYYSDNISVFFRSLEIEIDLKAILDKNIYVYLWGSSLNYSYSGKGSDIDLLIFYDGYIEKYKELNNYVESYNNSHKLQFDLSINNKTDLDSKKIYRYNRGPVITHELSYSYFPLQPAKNILNLDWKDITNDVYNASLILCNESKKILGKCDLKTERVKKIIKYSITVFTYLQYVRGIKYLNLNKIEKYLDRSDSFYENISRSIELKKLNYSGMTLRDLYNAVKAIDSIIEEQEAILGIK